MTTNTLHILAAAALITVLAASCALMTGDNGSTATANPADGVVTDITVDAAKAMIDERRGDDGFVILDVRTPSEYAAGHIAGAVNIDFRADGFRAEAAKLDRGATYLVYCRTGNRSAQASAVLDELGFTGVYNMTGGYAGWAKAGHPVVK